MPKQLSEHTKQHSFFNNFDNKNFQTIKKTHGANSLSTNRTPANFNISSGGRKLPDNCRLHPAFMELNAVELTNLILHSKNRENPYYFGVDKNENGDEYLVVCYRRKKFIDNLDNIVKKIITLERLEKNFNNDMKEVVNGLVTLVAFGLGGTLIKERLPAGDYESQLPLNFNAQVSAIAIAKELAKLPQLKLIVLTQCTEYNYVDPVLQKLFAPVDINSIFSKVLMLKKGIIEIKKIVDILEKNENIVGTIDLLIINNSKFDVENPKMPNEYAHVIVSDPKKETHVVKIIERLGIINNISLNKVPWLYYSSEEEVEEQEAPKFTLHYSSSLEEDVTYEKPEHYIDDNFGYNVTNGPKK